MQPRSTEEEEEFQLQLALAISASETEAKGSSGSQAQPAQRARGAGQPPPQQPELLRGQEQQAQAQRPTNGSSGGSAFTQQLGRLADGFKRFLQPPEARERATPTSSQPPPQPQQQPAWPPSSAPTARPAAGGADLARDEALARALQDEYNREQQQAQQTPQRRAEQQQGAAGPAPQPPYPSYPPAQPGPGGGGGFGFNASPPPQPSRPLPHTPPRLPVLPAAGDSGACAGCGGSLTSFTSIFGGGGRYITALGRSWHPGCFRCAACGEPLAGGSHSGVSFTVGSEDGLPYHPACHRDRFHPRCAVCGDFVPTEPSAQGARIMWSEVPFWRDKFCPAHSQDGTKRCTGCTRMQPRGQQWAELDDGRSLCLDCLATLVADTADCQPLYDNVLRFFAGLGMPLPARPPLMLVPAEALNQAESSETHGQGRSGPVFHTRGLCLTEEWTSFTTVLRVPRGRGGGGLLGGLLPGFGLERQTVQRGPTRTEVTAILVLYGLPLLLTGSILAHEAMHAWLRLGGYRGLPPEVEEGMCQLMAELWLAQEAAKQQPGSYEERLASFLSHQIRTDTSPVYGDGYRAALDAYQRLGLPALLAHLRQTGRLPT